MRDVYIHGSIPLQPDEVYQTKNVVNNPITMDMTPADRNLDNAANIMQVVKETSDITKITL